MRRAFIELRRPRILLIAGIVAMTAIVINTLVTGPRMHAPSSSTYAADVPAWTTFGYDNSRSGFNPTEGLFTSMNKAWDSPAMDGLIYAQPLVLADRAYVATENDTVYAVSTATGAIIWSNHLAQPVDSTQVSCNPVYPPALGITSTPVIDRATGLLYTTAFVSPGHWFLFAVNLAGGATVWSRLIDPPTMPNPLNSFQRPALTLANGYVYTLFGGLDCIATYHGYVVGVRTDNTGPVLVYSDQISPTDSYAGFWAPAGAVVDPAGNLFVASGNGSSLTSYDHGNSIIRLSPQLVEQDFWAIPGWQTRNLYDYDLGAMNPRAVGNGYLFQADKSGTGYLVPAASGLGGLGTLPAFADHVCNIPGVPAIGGSAYIDPVVFVTCQDGLHALYVDTTRPSFTQAWWFPGSVLPGFPPLWPGPPTIAGGIIWFADVLDGNLFGLDPVTGAVKFIQAGVGTMTHFTSPSVAGGHVFLAVNNSPGFNAPHLIAWTH